MADIQSEWLILDAIKPFLLTVLFLFASLVHLSFPNRFRGREALLVVLSLASMAWFNSAEFFPDDFLYSIYLRTVIIYISYFLYLVLREDEFAEKSTNIQSALTAPPKNPWLRGYKLLFNGRGIDTDWELPYLWRNVRESKLSRSSPRAPTKASSEAKMRSRGRLTAVAVRIGYFVLNFVVFCLYYEFLDPALWVRPRPSDTTKEKESIFRRAYRVHKGNSIVAPITIRDLEVRVWAVAASTVDTYLSLSMYHDLCAIVFIASGLDEDWEWPPLYGSITEAYTMRRYWSIFWHRLIYKSFNAHAGMVLKSVGLNQQSLLYRYLRNHLVFLLSALQHMAVSWRVGNPCAGKDFKYWVLQPIAFVIEGVVQSFWSRMKQRLLLLIQPQLLGVFERTVGYVWVLAWLLWWEPRARFAEAFCRIE